ncbi:MAG TPA: EAL domain-containing protein [Candidatus Nanoarchaeia archaeon]|nr:EAL domain-containing protein [Candidatus Nanoarchaeia archaeon]
MTTAVLETLECSNADLLHLSEGMQVALQAIRPVNAVNGEVHAYELLVRHAQEPSTSRILSKFQRCNAMPLLNQALAQTAYQCSNQGASARSDNEEDPATNIPPHTVYQFNIPPQGLTSRRRPLHRSLPQLLLELEKDSPHKGLVGVEITEEPRLTQPQRRILFQLHEAGIPIFLDDCLTPYRSTTSIRNSLGFLNGVKVGWEIMQPALGNRDGMYNRLARQRVQELAGVCATAGKLFIAEGVNFDRDQSFLREWGISHYQHRKETGRIRI